MLIFCFPSEGCYRPALGVSVASWRVPAAFLDIIRNVFRLLPAACLGEGGESFQCDSRDVSGSLRNAFSGVPADYLGSLRNIFPTISAACFGVIRNKVVDWTTHQI